MATTSAPVAGRHSGAAPLPRPSGRAGFIGSLRSEFTKIRSTRSTYWALLALVVITVGFGALASAGAAHNANQLGPDFDPTQRSLFGLYFGQLVMAVLGALCQDRVPITLKQITGCERAPIAGWWVLP